MPDNLLQSARRVSRQWLTELSKAHPVIVVIDNVADYYWEGTAETWRIQDFPCLAPPWPLTFLEYRAPARIVERGETYPFDKEALGQHFGILLDSVETGTVPAFRGLPAFDDILPGHRDDMIPAPAEGVKWVQQASVFTELRGDILLRGTFSWVINETGSLCDGFERIGGLPFLPPFGGPDDLSTKDHHEMGHNCWTFLAPALLAISFMHCRNTVIQDVAPPPKLERANIKRGKVPCVHYKTLEIAPVKKILATQGLAESTGLKHALHICRGHFKDYRQHGLFGKRKGLYWWDMHIRGTTKQGLVVKDYTMPPPGGVQ
jgi:hypothetical protein